MLRGFRRHLCLVVAALAGAQAWTLRAAASGAFFAQPDAPIHQVGEQVLLVANADGTTTAVFQTEYEGDAAEFAWLLPVAGMPTELTVTRGRALRSPGAAHGASLPDGYPRR